MERVRFTAIVDEGDFVSAQIKDPRSSLMGVEVLAKGKVFKEKIMYLKGQWSPEEYRNTDEDLVHKFNCNVLGVLSESKAKRVTHSMLAMETVENVAEFMDAVVP
jgi:hypothetical protein